MDITLQGIDQAISNLNYRNKNALKHRLVYAIRQFYGDESSLQTLKEIETDELIKLLWDTGNDPANIKNRRKNLSSVKSSVNVELKKLYKEGENTEGVIIGPTNVFIMSDEAKDDALKALRNRVEDEGTVSLGQIKNTLNIMNEILSNLGAIADLEKGDGTGKLEELKSLIRGLSEKVGLEGSQGISGEKEQTGGPGILSEDIEEGEAVGKDGGEGSEDGVLDRGDSGDGGKDNGIGVDDYIGKAGAEEEIVLDKPVATGDMESQEEEVLDDVEEVETDDVLEEGEDEEEIEAVQIEDDVEEVEDEIGQGLVEVDEGLEEIEGGKGEGYTGGSNEEEKEIQKSRLLAEEFDSTLSAMDKYFNQYILIPEGEYVVGARRIKKTERPEHLMLLPSFYMGKFNITNALFEIFVEKTGYRTTAEKCGYGTVYNGRSQRKTDEGSGLETITWNSTITSKTVKGACWYQPSGPGSTLHKKRNHPVVQVSLEDAMAFASWTGKRLPTEDEWEAASRTANGYVFPWGNDRQKKTCNIEESYIGDTSSVDKYIEFENDFGIADTMGNVLEWTMDISEICSYGRDGTHHYIVKGGSWISDNDIYLFTRTELESQSHSNILGFRCVAY